MIEFLTRLRDVKRIQRAFECAAARQYTEALSILENLKSEWARDYLEVLVLKGALLCLVGRHREAMTTLIGAAQCIKSSPRATKNEMEYMIAYLHQYWQPSADALGITKVTSEERDALHVEGPIVLSKVRRRIKRKFPLHTEFTGIQIVD